MNSYRGMMHVFPEYVGQLLNYRLFGELLDWIIPILPETLVDLLRCHQFQRGFRHIDGRHVMMDFP